MKHVILFVINYWNDVFLHSPLITYSKLPMDLSQRHLILMLLVQLMVDLFYFKISIYVKLLVNYLGKHVIWKSLSNSNSDISYKKTLLAICDSNYRFIYAKVGSETDAAIFENSNLLQSLQNGDTLLPKAQSLCKDTQPLPYWFLSDTAFPLLPYLMTPHCGRKLQPDQLWHNRELSRGRSYIENAFGVLAARWQILLNTDNIWLENLDTVLMTTIMLHNFMINFKDQQYISRGFVDRYTDTAKIVPGQWRDIVQDKSCIQSPEPCIVIGNKNASFDTIRLRNDLTSLLYNLKTK